VPYLPDAEITAVFPKLIEYTSAISSISATLFYRDELAALEWQERGSTIFAEKANLSFSKDDYTLMIIITPGEDKGRIKVVLNLEAKP
jgi:hypothetical protein